MSKEDLRKVEIREPVFEKNSWGEVVGTEIVDEFYDEGLFHGWNNDGELKGIVEIDGKIHLIPYTWIKFIS